MKKTLVRVAVENNMGRVRRNNEDSFLADGRHFTRDSMNMGARLDFSCGAKRQLYAVCDGMGGLEGGENASACAVEQLLRRCRGSRVPRGAGRLTALLEKISAAVREEGARKREDSGTTLVMAAIEGGRISCCNVGDSRAYRFREGGLEQLSLDHSEAQRMLSMGMLTAEEAARHRSRHIITQYLGMNREYRLEPWLYQSLLHDGDIYLLCSDGLTDMVDDGFIRDVLSCEMPIKEKSGILMNKALENGGRDNITIVLLEVMHAGKPGKWPLHLLTAAQLLLGTALLLGIADCLFYLLA